MAYRRPRPTKYNLRVRRSSAGLGLFTEDPIEEGDFIIEYYGPLLSDEEADAKQGKYLMDIAGTSWTIDGSPRENKARYINHACEPNCEVVAEGKRIFIYATRDIEPGEELGYDYGKEYVEEFIKPHGCRCRACTSSAR